MECAQQVFVGGLLGGMLIFVFSGWAMKAVGKCAMEVVIEVRRQFKEKPGIMEGKQKPDYGVCVSIVAALLRKHRDRVALHTLRRRRGAAQSGLGSRRRVGNLRAKQRGQRALRN